MNAMNYSWKTALFIFLNVVFAICLIAALYLFIAVLRGEDPLALLGILYLDFIFLITGTLLIILDKAQRILGMNKTLPFAAFFALTLAALFNVTMASVWLGIAASIVIFLACVITAVAVTMKHRDRSY